MAIESLCTSNPTKVLIFALTIDPPLMISLRYQGRPYCLRRRAREIPRPERQAMIDRGAKVPVKRQAALLDLSRSSVLHTATAVGTGSDADAAARRAAP